MDRKYLFIGGLIVAITSFILICVSLFGSVTVMGQSESFSDFKDAVYLDEAGDVLDGTFFKTRMVVVVGWFGFAFSLMGMGLFGYLTLEGFGIIKTNIADKNGSIIAIFAEMALILAFAIVAIVFKSQLGDTFEKEILDAVVTL